MKARVQTGGYETAWMSLPRPAWEGREQWSTGVELRAVYIGPRTRRVIMLTYSIWQGKSGLCEGDQYTLIDDPSLLRKLARYVPGLLEAGQ